jgi:hypothetical protein
MAAFDQALVRRNGRVWIRQGNLPLCDVCGNKDACRLRSALGALGKAQRAKVMIPECGAFMPVIGFTETRGLEDGFNTFRRGLGWARRVMVGQRVGLYDLKADQMFGQAVVENVISGPLEELLSIHASRNHLMKGLPEEVTSEALHRLLRRLYGTTYAGLAETFTVLELRREG